MTALQKKWVTLALECLLKNQEAWAECIPRLVGHSRKEKETEFARYTQEAKEIRQVMEELGLGGGK